MSVPLYMDEHIPGSITHGLRRRGADVLTVQEDGRERAPDPDLLDRAGEMGRVVFTQDQDFLAIATQRQRAFEPFVGVIYAPQDQSAIGRYVEDLTLIALADTPDRYANRVQYLPL